ncbi:MAG: tetratricopeptide repeat protein [Thermosynechococcaceae cyanobacterium]
MASQTLPTFNLLSIGHRGVGKTVFLAGSYAELQAGKQVETQEVWFEGANDQAQQTIEKLLAYMIQTGQYPPATMKITDFTFQAKAKGRRQDKTLCEFQWSDIPGEICSLDNPDFESMLLNSHGCCVFIDAGALVKDETYLTQLEDTIKQVEVISALAAQSGLKYIFALILTKCDVLETGPSKLIKIEQKLRSLTTRLDAAHTVYRRFYSSIPIIPTGNISIVKAEGASVPILWLVSELGKAYKAKSPQNLGNSFEQTLSNAQPAASPSYINLQRPELENRLLPTVLATIAGIGVVAGLVFGASQLFSKPAQTAATAPQEQEKQTQQQVSQQDAKTIAEYEKALQKDPKDTVALQNLIDLHQKQGEYDTALGYIEQLMALKPKDMNLFFQKANLFAALGRRDQEEATYDAVLSKESDNVMALTNKAILRSTQGDLDTARTLFAKAEAAVPDGELKKTIQEVAKQWLESATQ